MNQDFLAIVAGFIAVLTLIGLLHRMFLKKVITDLKDIWTWFRKFQRDWDGEPAEPGRDAIAGVMQRLNRIDGELQRNGGDSLKDKVISTWEMTENLDLRVDTIEIRQQEIKESLSHIKKG